MTCDPVPGEVVRVLPDDLLGSVIRVDYGGVHVQLLGSGEVRVCRREDVQAEDED